MQAVAGWARMAAMRDGERDKQRRRVPRPVSEVAHFTVYRRVSGTPRSSRSLPTPSV